MSCTLEPTPTSYNGLPISTSNINSAISQLNEIVNDIMDITKVPGISIAVVLCGDTVYANGFGVKNKTCCEPVDRLTVFPLAGLSESIGATVIARVIAQSQVKWKDPIIKYLPTFELSDKYVTENVTIGDMYCHRSGLPSLAGDSLEDLGFTQEEIIKRLRYVPLLSFRDEFRYVNFGPTIAATAVAVSQNVCWNELSKKALYDPLCMASTFSTYQEFVCQQNRVTPYRYNILEGTWEESCYPRDPDEQSPTSGVSSNVTDLAEWMKLILSEGDYKIKIDTVVVDQMLTPRIPVKEPISDIDSRSTFYGFGIDWLVDSSGRVQFGHSGAFLLGASTHVTLLPSEQLGIVILTNGGPIGIPEAISRIFFDIVEYGDTEYDWLKLLWERFSTLYQNPSILQNVDLSSYQVLCNHNKYVGKFENKYYGKLKIKCEYNKLVLYLGKKKQFELMYWHDNIFYYCPTGENGKGITGVFFTDSLNCVKIENLEKDLNVFHRLKCKSSKKSKK